MLARKTLPEQFLRWNRRWGAPFGRNRLPHRLALTVAPARWRPWIVGPFGFQPDNSATRRFEYPWAFHATTLRRGMTAVDLGGGLAGLQFVLDKAGLTVVNVDPSDAAPMGWPVDAATFRALNRAFGTNVELRRTFLKDAGIEDASVDRVFCISTLEHVPDDAIASILREIRRILRPGGQCVLTVDLFLDLAPFTDRATNASGRNVDLSWVVGASGLTLTTGDRAELNGFPEFDPRRVQASLGDLLYATHVPALTQALVLTRSTS